MRYFRMFMILFYMIAGFLLIFLPDDFLKIGKTQRYIAAGLFILYSVYRLYTIRNQKNEEE